MWQACQRSRSRGESWAKSGGSSSTSRVWLRVGAGGVVAAGRGAVATGGVATDGGPTATGEADDAQAAQSEATASVSVKRMVAVSYAPRRDGSSHQGLAAPVTPTEELLAAGPAVILGMVRRPVRTTDSVHWHGLAQTSAAFARDAFEAGDEDRGMAWTRCAVTLYDGLAEDESGPHSFGVSGMFARANAILACGPLAGDDVRDPAVIFAWVRASLDSSPADAVVRTEVVLQKFERSGPGSHVLDRDNMMEARKLRETRGRLGVVALLVDRVPIPADLDGWLAIRDRLV